MKMESAVRTMESDSLVDWFDEGQINEIAFCEYFLKRIPLKCINGKFFGYDGMITDSEVEKEIYQMIKDRVAYAHFKDFADLPSGHLLPAACGESDMDWKAILNGIGERNMIALFEYEIPDDLEEGIKRCADYIKNL